MKEHEENIKSNQEEIMSKLSELIESSDLSDDIELAEISLQPRSACIPPCRWETKMVYVNGKWKIKKYCSC